MNELLTISRNISMLWFIFVEQSKQRILSLAVRSNGPLSLSLSVSDRNVNANASLRHAATPHDIGLHSFSQLLLDDRT